ncbi:MAG: hypothetical protein HY355_02240 [Armatimonadetes bacterium]|nr:hypothetical protein [Armatimonadota bacterium]
MESALEILERAELVLRRHLSRLPTGQRQAIEQEVVGLLRMARDALPKELHHAAWLLAEAEGTLARAREEARRLILDAQAHARTVAGAASAGPAVQRGEVLLDEVRREAERIRSGADEYAAEVLQRLETELQRVLATIRRGQEVLRASGVMGRRDA